jgi:hypothetical protein
MDRRLFDLYYEIFTMARSAKPDINISYNSLDMQWDLNQDLPIAG